MRLIDADALLIEHCDGCDAFDKGLCDHDVCGAAQLIQEAPTIDAVEVVRCKNCAWYRNGERICTNPHCTKSYYGCRVREEHFCSFGERKGEDDG